MVDRSLIAGANAWFRASESERSENPILRDPFAKQLAERDPRIQAIRFARFSIPPLARAIEELKVAHCTRHAAIDTLVLRAVDDGFRQLVIVGAGYDMRAARFADRLRSCRVIEIDHPATQARKLARLGATRWAECVPADLQVEDLGAALDRGGWDPSIPTCFVAEGFVHYLTLHRFELLLSAMARAPRRRVILSFIRTEMYLRADSTFISLIKAVREIPRLHFTVPDLEAQLAKAGLSSIRVWPAAAQIEELVPAARGRAIDLSQDVAQAESG